MTISVLRLLGERIAHKTLAQNSRVGGLLDIKLGFSMLKDKRVPFRSKLLAVGLGAAVIALLVALEFPLEWLLALVPVFGLLADIMTDGLEAVIGTWGVAALILPHVTPKQITQQIRNEHAGVIEVAFQPEPLVEEPVHPSYDQPQPTQKLISSQS